MNKTTATITGVSIVVAERNDMGLICETFLIEDRPASFELADVALATVSMVRTGPWELGADGTVEAPVTEIDNTFHGVVAARIWDKVETTHSEWIAVAARWVEDGDLISDMELSEAYVVAGSRISEDTARVHMVGEAKTWNDRHTTDFPAGQLVMVARKR